jgi:hypothetical protein
MDDPDSNCICDYGGVRMTTREEEMAKLKARYAKERGNPAVEQITPEKKAAVQTVIKRRVVGRASIGEKIRGVVTPYLHIIENDFRKVMGLKSLEEIEKEKTYDPLMAAWKRGRNL